MSDALKLEHTAESLLQWTKTMIMAIGSMRRFGEKNYQKSWANVREAHDYLRFLDLPAAPLEPSEPSPLTLEGEIAALQSVSSFLAEYLKITPAQEDLILLDDTDIAILRYLKERPGVAKSQEDIAAGAVADRKTVGARLNKLREAGYVKRPDGKKTKDGITDAGIERLNLVVSA